MILSFCVGVSLNTKSGKTQQTVCMEGIGSKLQDSFWNIWQSLLLDPAVWKEDLNPYLNSEFKYQMFKKIFEQPQSMLFL